MLRTYPITIAVVVAGMLLAATTRAALPPPPPPTPAQQEAAAAKKAKADAQAAQDKAELAASMDAVAGRWRARAAGNGWATHAPVAIAAAPAAGAQAASAAAVSMPVTGAGPAGQPAGQLTQAGSAVPIRSEKFGTAPPSADVKKRQTQAQPHDAPPTVVKKNTPQVNNR